MPRVVIRNHNSTLWQSRKLRSYNRCVRCGASVPMLLVLVRGEQTFSARS